jgi:hypothetical protein
MTPTTLNTMFETLIGFLWIVAGPVQATAGLLLLGMGACDRNKQTAMDGLRAFALGLLVCLAFKLWTDYAGA